MWDKCVLDGPHCKLPPSLEWENLTDCQTLWVKSIPDLCASLEWGDLTDCRTLWGKSMQDLCASSH